MLGSSRKRTLHYMCVTLKRLTIVNDLVLLFFLSWLGSLYALMWFWYLVTYANNVYMVTVITRIIQLELYRS